MDCEKLASDQWKATREFANTATNISLLLFAALIVAWMGMWEKVDSYRRAASSPRPGGQRNAVFQTKPTAWSELERRASQKDLSPTFKARILQLKNDARENPLSLEERLRNDPKKAWEAVLLAQAIASSEHKVRVQQQLLTSFIRNRTIAERTSFKLLGLEFSVNSFWAWIVWLMFFVGGILHLWLVRRGILRRCRATWDLLFIDVGLQFSDARKLADSLPIWVRPLPRSEKWVAALTRSARTDAAMDPLGGLCVLLMLSCTWLAIAVVRMSVIATSLIATDLGFQFLPLLHAASLCALCGVALALLATWPVVPEANRRRKAAFPTLEPVELLGRRTWLWAVLYGSGSAILYGGTVNNWMRGALLQKPRFRHLAISKIGRRRPKFAGPIVESGFYTDVQKKIHYVPDGGRARSLAGMQKSSLIPWTGTIDNNTFILAHPSAVVPLTRKGVKGLASEKKYEEAFNLVRAAINADAKERERAGKMPNLQLYDLLGAIARKAQSKPMLEQVCAVLAGTQVIPRRIPQVPIIPSVASIARQDAASSRSQSAAEKKSLGRASSQSAPEEKLLARASPQPAVEEKPSGRAGEPGVQMPQVATVSASPTGTVEHSRHSKRKKKAPASLRQVRRLDTFKAVRLPLESWKPPKWLEPREGHRLLTLKPRWSNEGLSAAAASRIHIVSQRNRAKIRRTGG